MGARGEALAKQFEAKAAEFTAAIEKLSDADWKKVTTAEKWSVGVTAHHVAGAHEPISNIVKTLSAGQSIPGFTMPMLDEMNAKHAKDFANVTKAETLDIHTKGVVTAAAVVRGIADGDFDKSGVALTGMPPLSAQQAVEGILVNHINEHLGSIRATVGS
jgi:hypothetical protein